MERGARAESLRSLPDPLYAHRPFDKQAQEPLRRIGAIVYPTLGLPALASYCGRFTVWVRTGTDLLRRDEWRAELFTKWDHPGRGQRFRLFVNRVDRSADGKMVRLNVALPAAVGREVYHLRVRGPDGLDDRQPRAVRVYGRLGKTFRVVAMADHQLWDPSYKVRPGAKNNGSFPSRGQKEANKRITLQGIREVELLDPEMVLYLGDFLFGLDYRKEYPEMWQWWHQNRFATFMVPGNHDAYARYRLRLRGNWTRMGQALISCRSVFPRKKDWWRVFRYLVCAYKDIRDVLFDNLVHDGIESWKRTFGPPYYSFDLGPFHFIGLNTYDGTNRRRHAYSLWMMLSSLKLGAPAVDNYGGYLSTEQLAWVRKDAADAERRGKVIVFFGHHDPRGNLDGERYHSNEPFPTSPIGLDHFEEWNFDDKQWDSNPRDARGVEHSFRNNGIELLRIVARYGSYYLSGHVHEDQHDIYRKGEAILPGILATHPLEFIRVTSAASGVRSKSYWGYRVFEADTERRRIDTRPFDDRLGLLSVPAGNFWAQSRGLYTLDGFSSMSRLWERIRGKKGGARVKRGVQLINELPTPVEVTLRYRLSASPRKGYSFRVTGPGLDPGGAKASLKEMIPDPNGRFATFFVSVNVPGGIGFPLSGNEAGQRLVTFEPARNLPPRARISLKGQGLKLEVVAPRQTLRMVLGSRLELDASPSRDPERRPLLAYLWQIEHKPSRMPAGGSRPRPKPKGKDKETNKGLKEKRHPSAPFFLASRRRKVAFSLVEPGEHLVSLVVVDDSGASDQIELKVLASPSTASVSRKSCGCCQGSSFGSGRTTGVVFLILTLFLMVVWKGAKRK